MIWGLKFPQWLLIMAHLSGFMGPALFCVIFMRKKHIPRIGKPFFLLFDTNPIIFFSLQSSHKLPTCYCSNLQKFSSPGWIGAVWSDFLLLYKMIILESYNHESLLDRNAKRSLLAALLAMDVYFQVFHFTEVTQQVLK